jgi:hypothetical protein
MTVYHLVMEINGSSRTRHTTGITELIECGGITGTSAEGTGEVEIEIVLHRNRRRRAIHWHVA